MRALLFGKSECGPTKAASEILHRWVANGLLTGVDEYLVGENDAHAADWNDIVVRSQGENPTKPQIVLLHRKGADVNLVRGGAAGLKNIDAVVMRAMRASN